MFTGFEINKQVKLPITIRILELMTIDNVKLIGLPLKVLSPSYSNILKSKWYLGHKPFSTGKFPIYVLSKKEVIGIKPWCEVLLS